MSEQNPKLPVPNGVFGHRAEKQAALDEREKKERELFLFDMRKVLATPEGRRILGDLIERCQPFNSIWDNSSKLHYNAGRQDIGFYLLQNIEAADQEYLFQLMREHKDRKLAALAAQNEGEKNVR